METIEPSNPTSTPTSEFECQMCGVCCIPRWKSAGYVYLSADDEAKIRRRSLPVIARQDSEDVLDVNSYLGIRRLASGKRICVAFAGEPGNKCGCSIYEDRPVPCRTYDVGSYECRMARKRFGLDA